MRITIIIIYFLFLKTFSWANNMFFSIWKIMLRISEFRMTPYITQD